MAAAATAHRGDAGAGGMGGALPGRRPGASLSGWPRRELTGRETGKRARRSRRLVPPHPAGRGRARLVGR
ncbi:hypothetical protein, partial [Frankia sp. CiP1_Cm_nod1]|uniref:hypothetical protein n=1 Tax=Frankia sp. CiP1_Cm_nod1 TaxID=2897160 RepID=UPI002025861C